MSDPPSHYILRRETERRCYEFVDDADASLGSMVKSTITTAAGSFRLRGTWFGRRLVDLTTGKTLPRWQLPDGTQLYVRRFGRVDAHPLHRRWELFDNNGETVISVNWLATRSALTNDSFPLGRADLRPGLVPAPELIPLVADAFRAFEVVWARSGGM
jgi:hypothetical protein